MVEGVGWGEGETVVESDEGNVTLEVEGREPDFEVGLGDASTGDEEETGEGVVEVRLEGVEMFGVSEDDEVGEGVDINGGVSETVVEEGGLLPKTVVIKSVLLESGVGELNGLDDFVTMGLKGEALVEGGDEVEEFGSLGDSEGRGVRREVTGEDPRVSHTCVELGGGFLTIKVWFV